MYHTLYNNIWNPIFFGFSDRNTDPNLFIKAYFALDAANRVVSSRFP